MSDKVNYESELHKPKIFSPDQVRSKIFIPGKPDITPEYIAQQYNKRQDIHDNATNAALGGVIRPKAIQPTPIQESQKTLQPAKTHTISTDNEAGISLSSTKIDESHHGFVNTLRRITFWRR